LGAVRTPDGGFLVAGTFDTATLDTGGPILQGPVDPGLGDLVNFVAAVDGNGVTRWAYRIGGRKVNGSYTLMEKLAAVGDGAVLCGEYAGADQLGLPPSPGTSFSAFVAHVPASGQIAAYPIQGDDLLCASLAAGPAGSAVVAPTGSGTVSVGSQTFSADARPAFFVLDIAL
jgi:hypothetical protein